MSIGQSFSAFYGDSFSVFLENRSLHAIPVRRGVEKKDLVVEEIERSATI